MLKSVRSILNRVRTLPVAPVLTDEERRRMRDKRIQILKKLIDAKRTGRSLTREEALMNTYLDDEYVLRNKLNSGVLNQEEFNIELAENERKLDTELAKTSGQESVEFNYEEFNNTLTKAHDMKGTMRELEVDDEETVFNESEVGSLLKLLEYKSPDNARTIIQRLMQRAVVSFVMDMLREKMIRQLVDQNLAREDGLKDLTTLTLWRFIMNHPKLKAKQQQEIMEEAQTATINELTSGEFLDEKRGGGGKHKKTKHKKTKHKKTKHKKTKHKKTKRKKYAKHKKTKHKKTKK